jgi:glycosyltransferase involved in cell wall biosynthesis
MRILMVLAHYAPAQLGGIVRSVAMLSKSLGRAGHEIDVYTTDSDHRGWMSVPLERRMEMDGIQVCYFHTPTPRLFQYSGRLARACNATIGQFDLVHCHDLWQYPGLTAMRAARIAGVPYVISPHGILAPASLAQKRLRKAVYLRLVAGRALGGAAAIHCTSEIERRSVATATHRPTFVVPNGVDLPVSAAATPARHDEFVVGFLGRLHPVKSLDVLIAAVGRVVCGGHRRIRLWLAGPDDGAELALRTLTDRLHLQRYVRFVGPVDPGKTPQFLREIDLLALVSQTENFGCAAAEAMSVGVPVLVSTTAGICHDVARSRSGWVVPVDESAVARALTEILGAPEEVRSRGRLAAQFARSQYTNERVAAIMARAYADILTGGRSADCRWQGA